MPPLSLCGAKVILLRVAHFHTRDERACELADAEADAVRAEPFHMVSARIRELVSQEFGVPVLVDHH